MSPANVVSERRRGRRTLIGPPTGLVNELENAARKDVRVARLILGLYDSILGSPSSCLFPGYTWSPVELAKFPASLHATAKQIFEWGQNPDGLLNEILISQIAIVKAVRAIRRRSPFGRKYLKVAARLRRKYPLNGESRDEPPETTKLHTMDILDDALGLPLIGRTMRRIRAFKPAAIQIAGQNQFMSSNDWAPGVVNIRLNSDGYTVESIQLTVEVEGPAPKPRIIEGTLFDFFETGTEGVLWAVIDDENLGYDNLHFVEAGDHLTILDQLGYKLWSGAITCDRKAGWRRYPLNPKYGQPLALGHWVHWTQKGFKPDEWAGYFIRSEYDRLRGILKKSRKTKNENANFLGPTRAPR
jgi:hypothetical protein